MKNALFIASIALFAGAAHAETMVKSGDAVAEASYSTVTSPEIVPASYREFQFDLDSLDASALTPLPSGGDVSESATKSEVQSINNVTFSLN